MRCFLLLRIASILTLLLAAGHTSGGVGFWSPAGDTEVLRAMRSFHFDAGGASRTYMDFFLGFGFTISAYLFIQAVALWQLASIAKSDARRVRPLIGSFLLVSVASAALAWKFIFVVPVVSFSAVAVCLGLAFYAAGKRRDA
ncbi:hypothetical protein GCM10008098_29290 [Rhodanobacter panaciterrae]|uniref:Uncharacterized protein n=1 Tax=Rhodanobacter panaciterrae TaxID=490572 RepID=A0ABQ3A5S2_9GAMM|nr:hypothetical protein [Rhodanobacter panaciterrae]GGY34073.1 hypothetical protein GCM10008098_29290 [Rhodanobacter panaciterrae]